MPAISSSGLMNACIAEHAKCSSASSRPIHRGTAQDRQIYYCELNRGFSGLNLLSIPIGTAISYRAQRTAYALGIFFSVETEILPDRGARN
jgi:hypothetical protein